MLNLRNWQNTSSRQLLLNNIQGSGQEEEDHHRYTNSIIYSYDTPQVTQLIQDRRFVEEVTYSGRLKMVETWERETVFLNTGSFGLDIWFFYRPEVWLPENDDWPSTRDFVENLHTFFGSTSIVQMTNIQCYRQVMNPFHSSSDKTNSSFRKIGGGFPAKIGQCGGVRTYFLW